MLKQLTISNFAIIDKLEIIFKDGLTVLTGETGAGKSIIANALDFLLGSRGNSDLIKNGSIKAVVEGVFDVVGVYCSKPLLTISRELTSQGSKARINSSLASVSHLLYIREYLIDIHEQSEHMKLLKPEEQLKILDSCGDASHKKIIEEYKKLFEGYQILKSKINYHHQNSANIAKKLDFLEFQLNEIKSANIKDPNEENDLLAKREILLNKKQLIENSNLIYELSSGEGQDNLIATLSQIKKLILKSNEHDKAFEPYLEAIENTTSQIKELSSFVNNYRENIDTGSDNLNEIEERLDLFYNLKKKYGGTLEKVQEYLKNIEGELNNAQEACHGMPLLEELFKQKEKEINLLGEKLTKSREKTTKDFVERINDELPTLGFKEAVFVVEFIDCDLCINGKEQIQFLFSANPDEPPKPLLKVASGGELSRIMLAIKSIVVGAGFVRAGFPPEVGPPSAEKPAPTALTALTAPTMIFDEIDIGVSGEIASSVAKKLYKISRANQVICITHQPIICAMADSHFLIKKEIRDGITQVSLKEVTQSEKAEALATLLTPDKKRKDGITEDAKMFARSLLENAKKVKEKELIKTI